MPGGSLELKCVAVGSPMPFIKWRQGAIDLTPDDNLPVGRGVLQLKDVTASKNYTCIAASELGSIEFVAQVRVKALPQPPTELSVSDVTPNSVKLTWTIAGTMILSFVLRAYCLDQQTDFLEVEDVTPSPQPNPVPPLSPNRCSAETK